MSLLNHSAFLALSDTASGGLLKCAVVGDLGELACGLAIGEPGPDAPEPGLDSGAGIDPAGVDMLLVDLGAPGGAAAVETLRGRDRSVPLVLVGRQAADAAVAYELEAVDFLLRPLSEDRFAAALQRVRDRLDLRRLRAERTFEGDVVWAWRRGRRVAVRLSRTEWARAQGDYVAVHAGRESYLLRMTLGALQARCAALGLVQVHRSVLVRRSAVAAVQRDFKGRLELVIADGPTLRVGACYAKSAAAALGVITRRRRERASGRFRGEAEAPPSPPP